MLGEVKAEVSVWCGVLAANWPCISRVTNNYAQIHNLRVGVGDEWADIRDASSGVHFKHGFGEPGCIGKYDVYAFGTAGDHGGYRKIKMGELGSRAIVLASSRAQKGVLPKRGLCEKWINARFHRRFVQSQSEGGEHPLNVLTEYVMNRSTMLNLRFCVADAYAKSRPNFARKLYRGGLEGMYGCDLGAIVQLGRIEGGIDLDEWESRLEPLQWASLRAIVCYEYDPENAREYAKEAGDVVDSLGFMSAIWWGRSRKLSL